MKTLFSFILLALLLVSVTVYRTSATSPLTDNDVAIKELQSAAQEGLEQVQCMIKLEQRLVAEGLVANRKRRGGRRNSHKLRVSNESRSKTIEALGIVEASKKLKDRLNLTEKEAAEALPKLSLKDTLLEDTCAQPIVCNTSKYRTVDGSCNNLANPNWGQANTIFQRLLPAHYGNGIDSSRPASDGGALRNPREISLRTVKTYGLDEVADVTLSVMSFGQFITHDMALSEDFTFENGSSPACCDNQGQLPTPQDLHPQCMPIEISTNDPSYSISGNKNCMSFTRSKVGADLSCTFGQAEQLNSNTHYLDGSQIYGSDLATSNDLRSGIDGLLKTSGVGGRQLLPIAPGCEDQVNHELAVCFQAGDVRVEENPQLTAIHLIFLREHNRIAKELKGINPQWIDETLYQETRRIVVAQLQHIAYNEYLPALLGSQTMVEHGLALPTSGYGTGYDEAINPSIANDFTAAAFRITHSTIQGYLSLLNEADEEDKDRSYSLSDYFFDASRLMDDPAFFDSALRGLTKQPPQSIDPLYSSEVQSRLYRGNQPTGGDLIAITIQRGREHGIPGYNQFREWCGLPKVKTFDELSNEMFEEEINALRNVYDTVDDIDLYIGCLNEIHIPGTLMGPTAICIIADQFRKIKDGDRFFYDIGNQPHSFTPDQLNQLRQSSFARLICDNNDGSVNNMQPRAMRSPIETNQRTSCTLIPSMDLSYWKEI